MEGAECVYAFALRMLGDPAAALDVVQEAFETKFAGARPFYAEVEVRALITPTEAMRLLAS